ncbi:MAG: S9 family peptidase [Bacillota bacterium]|jgi:dipeptidyl aminopeptidase/acylaminoacyl peptidase
MKKITLIFLCLVSLLYVTPVLAAAEIPLRDFFRNPQQSGVKLAPDGEYLAFMQPFQNRMNLYVQKRGAKEALRITEETERDIASYFWKGNHRLIYMKDFKGDENYHLVAVDRDGGNLKDLTPFPGVRASICDDLEEDDSSVLVELNKRDPQVFDVYRLNVFTGDLKLIATNPGNITGWITDHQGKLRLAIASDGANTSLLYRDTEAQPFRTVLTTNFRESISPCIFTFDNKYIYAVSNIGRDRAALVKYDIAHAKEIKVIYSHPQVDVSGLSYSRKRKKLIAAYYSTWKTKLKFFDPQFKKIYRRLQKLLPDQEIAVNDTNRNEDIFIVRTYSDRSLGAYYLYETSGDKLVKLCEVSPWLNEAALCRMRPIRYKSRDGLTIHGYLTLPKGKPGKKLPVVVNPHGGPWTRDYWGFNPEVQFLANRGYAVLQVNYRGSTGYGRKFWEASFKQWGRKMQDDISDGVYWLIRKGIADPKRIAIYGGSYGGYATLAGVTFTPDLYACGIDYVGISNLLTFMKSMPPYWKPGLEKMYEMVGDPEKDATLLRAASPVFHADQIKVPLLVAQGAKDPRVNIDESNQIVAALQKQNIPVEYMVKENEGHGFRNEENRFEFYEAVEKFLAKNLGK